MLKRQQEGFLASLPGRSTHKSRHTKYPSQTLIPRITLFAIWLSFSSPPLHLCRFIRPLWFASFCLSFVRSLFVSFAAIMSETGEVVIDKDSGNNMENFDAFDDPHEEP